MRLSNLDAELSVMDEGSEGFLLLAAKHLGAFSALQVARYFSISCRFFLVFKE